jgi:hypothetical protein
MGNARAGLMNKTNLMMNSTLTVALVLGLAACSRDRPARGAEAHPEHVHAAHAEHHHGDLAETPAATDEAASRQTGSASDAIAQSRCQREVRCNNVGPDRTYSSVGDCVARIRSDWKDDLNARECPGGVNERQLDECLTEIRSEECESPFDTLARVSACTTGQICEG